MNETMKTILERRSIRKYSPEQITAEELDQILEAGIYAPSAGGRQSPLFVVCQDSAVNGQLGRLNQAAFHKIRSGRPPENHMYGAVEQPSIADDPTLLSAFYNAPTVITIFTQKGGQNMAFDCCVAAENMMLAAHSLGLGSCLIARSEETFASELGQRLVQEWNIPEDYEAKVHVLLGYPAGTYPKAKPRREGRVIRIPG